ncbi:hypothetical protein GC176_27210 [bacterium]|nr:hypothetical protein [bacterium]
MSDLLVSLTLVALASAGLFGLAVAGSRSCRASRRNLLACLTVLLGAAYSGLLWDRVLLSRLIPHADLIVLGNWFPLFAALLAGLAWTGTPDRLRRCLSSGALLAAGGWAVAYPLLGAAPQCRNEWQGRICLQTTPYSCSAASATTVLKAHGIEATEAEMADLCLTRSGTNWMGLYRGLSLKTQGTGWMPVVFETDAAGLRRRDSGPVILVAELPDSPVVDPVFREACGWTPGQAHSVVFFRFLTERTVEMGDPTFGRELWRVSDLDVLWTGRAIGLVPRGDAEHDSLLAARRN